MVNSPFSYSCIQSLTHHFLPAYANAAFNGSAGANIAPTLDLSKAIGGAVSTFWQTAFDIEKKVCTIAFTVNPITLAKAQAALIARYVLSPISSR